MKAVQEWYVVNNIDEVDSPALLVYKDRVKQNIEALLKTIDSSDRLRPHIKTHKSAEVSQMMMQTGIKKFKCATIAEAEMLANVGAPDILLAYQPVGPKAKRFAELVDEFTKTRFSCLIDNFQSASALATIFSKLNSIANVYIDLNVGMNRTGIRPEKAAQLFEQCQSLKTLRVTGLHAYDGHIRDVDYDLRKKKCDDSFSLVEKLKIELDKKYHSDLIIVAGGTPTYSIHCKRKSIICSPGTFIYWDKGYDQLLQEQHFKFAALVLARVISKPSDDVICIDLGHKRLPDSSVA
jgi:D-serine deaminase-like pyridoxal phosphate-dependent protein